MSLDQAKQMRQRKKQMNLLLAFMLVAVTVWSGWEANFSFYTVFLGLGEIYRFILYDFLPPDLSALRVLISPALDTIYMSYVGMVVGSLLSCLLAFLAAGTTSPYPAVQAVVRGLASVLRNIPALIWSIVLVSAFGIGPLVGTLALILTAIGTLTRAYAEVLEEIDMGQIEALKATGAGYFQVIGQGVMPQFFPGFVAWSLYKLELNVRASAIVGMVGGGGLGFMIQKGLKLFQFKEVCMAIILVILIVFGTEWITSKIRERIL